MQSLTADAETVRAWMRSIATSEARELGLDVIDVLKHRSNDHKVVLLCSSSRYGKCILKVLPRHLVRGHFRNHVATTRLARDHNTGIFPEVFHIGAHSSLEEWIPGQSLKFLPEEAWADLDFLHFLRRVHAFSRAVPRGEHDLTPAEIRVIAESHVRRSLGFLNYQGTKDTLVSLRRLYADRKQIRADLSRFEEVLADVRLPAYTVLGDLTAGNVVFHRPSERLVIIDVEDMTNGVLSFDCAWLLATIARRHCPEAQLMEAYRYISSGDFVAHDQEIRLMRILLKMLLENDLRIIQSDLRKTRHLLEVVRSDLNLQLTPEFA